MTNQKTENIIDMTTFKSTSSQDVTLLRDTLDKCRDLMADRLSGSLTDMLDRADDLFFDLVQKSGPSDHHFYFNAMREIRLKRSSVESGFKDSFNEIFAGLLKNGGADQAFPDKEPDMDIEETLALNATVEKIRHRCRAPLLELDQRMQELLENTGAANRNPLRPETVCHAFHDACTAIDSGIEIKLILFKLFEKYVARDMDVVYTDINSLLTESSVNARIRQNRSKSPGSMNQDGSPAPADRKNNGIARDRNYFIIANRIIKTEINQHIGQSTLPEFVRNFIYSQWSKLLLKIYIKEGVDSRAWTHAIEVIDDLVNCVSDRSSTNEKLMLSNVMPNLVQRLKFGMNVIPVKAAEGESFINELTRYHSELLDSAREEIGDNDSPEQTSEDITVPSFRTTASVRPPFMDELLVDNKPGKKNRFDLE